jgi:hypothetical protein
LTGCIVSGQVVVSGLDTGAVARRPAEFAEVYSCSEIRARFRQAAQGSHFIIRWWGREGWPQTGLLDVRGQPVRGLPARGRRDICCSIPLAGRLRGAARWPG